MQRDVSPDEDRQVVRAQSTLAALAVALFGVDSWAFGTWGGVAGVAVGLVLALIWRKRHIAIVVRLERRR